MSRPPEISYAGGNRLCDQDVAMRNHCVASSSDRRRPVGLAAGPESKESPANMRPLSRWQNIQVDTQSWGRLDKFSEGDLKQLQELFDTTWWAADRTEEELRRVVAETDIVCGLTDPRNGRLVAFARVLTDFAAIALLLDVVVIPHLRGQGLGEALMDAVLSEPRLQGVRSIELVCQPDLVDFYQRWGFTTEVGRSLLMRRTEDPTLRSVSNA